MKPTLIIVDDSKEMREHLFGLLIEEFEILADVGDAKSAVEAVGHLKPQLVLMDVVMPEMSGIEAARVIHAKYENPPAIVMLSGVKEEGVVLQALEAGAKDYLFKPVDSKKLKKLLWELLKSAA